MADLINRQTVIDELDEFIDIIYDGENDKKIRSVLKQIRRCVKKLPSAEEESFEWCTDCKEYDREKHCCHRWTKVIRNTVEEIKNEQRWIPCSEQMPKTNAYVLATTVWGYVTIAERLGAMETYDNYDWFISEGNNNAESEDILAWMPLPEPYKE